MGSHSLPTPRIVLASGSPRRRTLLAQLNVPFTVMVSGIDETADSRPVPEDLVRHLARRKAAAVAAQTSSDFVIGCDTIVVIDGLVLGKPADALTARRMLRRLSGRDHDVYTGVAIVACGRLHVVTSALRTIVTMRALQDQEITDYVNTGEPFDKAGGYAAQGVGASLIDHIQGCSANVVGLPLCELITLFGILGYGLPWAVCSGINGKRCPRLTDRAAS